jgi:predicted nucleotidyltransferase
MLPSSTPHEVQYFLQQVSQKSLEICGEHFLSLRVFGSALDGEYTPGSSDIDFLVVVKDSCPDAVLDGLSRELLKLEIKNNIAGIAKAGPVFAAFSSGTVFFRSHFAVRQSTIKSLDFGRMADEMKGFSLAGGEVLKFLGKILLPWRLVIANVVRQSKIVTGDDSLSDQQFPIPWRAEAARNFAFTLGVAYLGAALSFFSSDGTHISLEALKWYFINVCSIQTRMRCGTSVAANLLYDGKRGIFLGIFEKLRANYRPNRFFSYSLPMYITYLQLALWWRRRSMPEGSPVPSSTTWTHEVPHN